MKDSKIFEENYFKGPLFNSFELDTVSNPKDHINYLDSFCKIFSIPTKNILEIGYGTGELFRTSHSKFKPLVHTGYDISQYAYKKLLPFSKKNDCKIFCQDFREIDFSNIPDAFYDVTISMGMAHYLESKQLDRFFQELSRISKYLYFYAPTKNEVLDVRKEGFYDPYANLIPKATFNRLFKKHKLKKVGMYILQSYHIEIPMNELWEH